MNILILGITGMLGSMVYRYLSFNRNLRVFGTTRATSMINNDKIFNLEAGFINEEDIKNLISKTNPAYVINCIGIINKYCTIDNPKGIQNAISINSLFPHRLAYLIKLQAPETKILQIATDCVFSGKKGNYIETDVHDPVDIYGKSKTLGEVVSHNLLNIRCSIIGPELYNKISLLEWFLALSENEIVNGYNHHFWNGVTTLQFAQLCENIIIKNEFNSLRELNHVLHYCINESVSKYQLLILFDQVFKKNMKIIKIDDSYKMDRTLVSIYLKNQNRKMIDSLSELKKFILESKFYEKNYVS